MTLCGVCGNRADWVRKVNGDTYDEDVARYASSCYCTRDLVPCR